MKKLIGLLILFILVITFLGVNYKQREYISAENFDMIYKMGVISTIHVYENGDNVNLTNRSEILSRAIYYAKNEYDYTKMKLLLTQP